MDKKTISQQISALLERREVLDNSIADFANRESLTDAEKVNYEKLCRERKDNIDRVTSLNQQIEIANREVKIEKSKCQVMREILGSSVKEGIKREITLGSDIQAGNNGAGAGAVELTINDLMPTLNEGLELPSALHVVTGVTGNQLQPYSIDDVEVEELGENASLTDQDLNFAHITVTPRHCGMTVGVSNSAIDNASFDLLAFVQQKFTLAMKKYIAKKVFSLANWTGNKGGFSGLSSSGTITLGTDNAYSKILEAVAAFTDKGFDVSGVCLVMDANTEAKLKATEKADGQGGFVIENGKCAGYDYVVSHYINTVLGGDAKTAGTNTNTSTLYTTTAKYIGIGYFAYESVQQHGAVRLSVDGISKEAAKVNKTFVTLNTEMSFTDLSVKINGGVQGGGTQAFAIYTIA